MSETDNMLVRVAVAIQGPLGCCTADAMFAARRVIEAMREPTDSLMEAGNEAAGEFFHRHTEVARWHAMIDAILKEGE